MALPSLKISRLRPQHLCRLLELSLIGSLAFTLAGLFWSLVPAPADLSVPMTGDSGNRPAVAPAPAAFPGRARLLESLFGAIRGPGDVTTAGEPAVETGLDLNLKGILAHRENGRKFALIADETGEERVYSLNENIQGAEITGIEAGRVILRRNGVYEYLGLDREGPETYRENPAVTGPGPVSGTGEVSSRVVGGTVPQNQIENLPQLLRQARAVPYEGGNGQSGYRVVEIQQNSVLQELGIREEDVIHSVNGIQLGNAGEALQAYRDLKTAGRFSIGLLRGGREVTIDFTVQ